MTTILVLGASGLVGGAIARALAARGDTVIAAARNTAALEALAKSSPNIRALPGDVGSDATAQALAASARGLSERIDAVVASLNPPRSPMRLSETSIDNFDAFLRGSLLSHLAAAKALLPLVADGGSYVAIGGAASDFVWPEHGHISVSQAAQRMLFRVLVHECQSRPVKIREYVIAAMVHDGSGSMGVSAATIADDFARSLDRADAPAVTVFPPKA